MQRFLVGSIGILAAVGAAVLFHVIITAVLGIALSTILSGLTFLDPLYAGDRLESIWSTLATLLLLHGIHTLTTAPLVGGTIARLQSRYLSRNFYLIGAFLSLGLYFVLAFIFRALWPILFSEGLSANVWRISLIFTGLFAPLIGLTAVFAVRRWSKSNDGQK
ncbi:MAG: hypothetical protein AAF614_18590 [Chloroflexota bacterium]